MLRHPLFSLSAILCLLCLGLATPLAAEGLVTGFLKRKTAQARAQRVQADGQAIGTALHIYKITCGEFPTEKQGLKALVEKPTEGPVPRRWTRIMDKIPLDAWGREYRLITRMKDDQPVLIILSDGPDLETLTDDIEMPVKQPKLEEEIVVEIVPEPEEKQGEPEGKEEQDKDKDKAPAPQPEP